MSVETVLSHAIRSTSHLNWTNQRACVTQSGPHAARASQTKVTETRRLRRIRPLLVPGLCTGAGGMHPRISARQIRYAFEEVFGLREPADHNLSRMARREKKMRSMPLAAEEDERD